MTSGEGGSLCCSFPFPFFFSFFFVAGRRPFRRRTRKRRKEKGRRKKRNGGELAGALLAPLFPFFFLSSPPHKKTKKDTTPFVFSPPPFFFSLFFGENGSSALGAAKMGKGVVAGKQGRLSFFPFFFSSVHRHRGRVQRRVESNGKGIFLFSPLFQRRPLCSAGNG